MQEPGMTTTTEKKQSAERFDPAIEPRWREFWERAGIFKAGRRQGAPSRYILEMFPYPSGDLHVGHLKNDVIGDALTRYYVCLLYTSDAADERSSVDLGGRR